MTQPRIPTNVRSESVLASLPVGTKIQFRGKRITFRYSKQADGTWQEPPLVQGSPDVRTSRELARAIESVTNRGYAQVLK